MERESGQSRGSHIVLSYSRILILSPMRCPTQLGKEGGRLPGITGVILTKFFERIPFFGARQSDVHVNQNREHGQPIDHGRGADHPTWEHGGGFSVDAGLERLLRYCARPAFALERLREIDPEHLVYESTKPGPGGSVSLLLTTMQLLDRLAALIPPPRRHRHRYLGVLAPNSPLRAAVTALAAVPVPRTEFPAPDETTTEEPPHRKASRYVWAMLLARIYEVLPLVCPQCGGEMQIIAFITEAVVIREILNHLGEPTSPRLLPARGPPLWEMAGIVPDKSDPQAQPAPDYEFDQRVAW